MVELHYVVLLTITMAYLGLANYTKHSNTNPREVDGDIFLDLKNHSIEEIMNGDSYNQVRLEMLNGDEPEACKRCYREEESGVWSKRAKENQLYDTFTLEESEKQN